MSALERYIVDLTLASDRPLSWGAISDAEAAFTHLKCRVEVTRPTIRLKLNVEAMSDRHAHDVAKQTLSELRKKKTIPSSFQTHQVNVRLHA